MAQKKTDRRILHTRKLIYDAFIELLRKKPVSQISITELCDKATINRNTFYCHYNTPRDILLQLADILLVQIKEAIKGIHSSLETITITCRILKENQDICSVLLSENAELNFFKEILQLSAERNRDVMVKKANPLSSLYQEMLTEFIISGSSAAIQTWVNRGMKESPEDIAEFILTLCDHGSSQVSYHPKEKFKKKAP